jgi:hypothetical protein
MVDTLNPIQGTNNQPLSFQNAIFANDMLTSFSGTFQLVLQESDGNLVLQINDPDANPNAGMINRPVWSAYTQNQAAAFAVIQDDGNFVVYDSFQNPLWNSGTFGRQNFSGFVIIQDDGNLVIYDSDGATAIWQSGTSVGEAPGVNA